MKTPELEKKPANELQELLDQERIKLGELRFKLVNKQLKNVNEIQETKKNIARISTFLNAKPKEKNE